MEEGPSVKTGSECRQEVGSTSQETVKGMPKSLKSPLQESLSAP